MHKFTPGGAMYPKPKLVATIRSSFGFLFGEARFVLPQIWPFLALLLATQLAVFFTLPLEYDAVRGVFALKGVGNPLAWVAVCALGAGTLIYMAKAHFIILKAYLQPDSSSDIAPLQLDGAQRSFLLKTLKMFGVLMAYIAALVAVSFALFFVLALAMGKAGLFVTVIGVFIIALATGAQIARILLVFPALVNGINMTFRQSAQLFRGLVLRYFIFALVIQVLLRVPEGILTVLVTTALRNQALEGGDPYVMAAAWSILRLTFFDMFAIFMLLSALLGEFYMHAAHGRAQPVSQPPSAGS
jgi:hypothetical protein